MSQPAEITNQPIDTTANDEANEGKENVELMYIKIGDTELTATLEENTSAQALKEMMKSEPLTLNLIDYGGMEKGTYLDRSLPTEHTQMAPVAGDIMLSEDNVFLIYYEKNSAWPYTRLGKINDITQEELKKLLGSGDVTVTLSLRN